MSGPYMFTGWSGDGADVYQMPCRDADLPPEIRLEFVKKVYGVLLVMLIFTFGIASPFVFAHDTTLHWFSHNIWLLAIVGGLLMAQYMLNTCMACEMCFGGSSILQAYMRMMRAAPFNYLYLLTFSGCFGVLVGFVCAVYSVESVVYIFAASAFLIAGLTIYAVRTKADFTSYGPYIMVGILGILLMLCMGFLVPGSGFFARLIGAAGATLFGFIIIYDTQQIFGSASEALGGGVRKLEYTIDMYALAAFNLYLDFINFFFFLLECMGQRRE